jgi:hypothetical protein
MAEAPAMAEVLAQVMETLSPVQDAVIGYRHKLIEHGVRADEADAMAADFHHYVMQMLVASITPTRSNNNDG